MVYYIGAAVKLIVLLLLLPPLCGIHSHKAQLWLGDYSDGLSLLPSILFSSCWYP